MFCGTCGSKLPDNARFCEECGAMVQENLPPKAEAAPVTAPIKPVLKVQPKAEKPQKAPKPKKEKKKVNKGLIIGICAVLIVAVLAAVLIPQLFPRETIYVVVSKSRYGRDGSLNQYTTYEYDDCARLISKEIDYGEVEEVWDDELGIYVQISGEPGGDPAYVYEYEYDEYGNLIRREPNAGGTFEVEYEYDEDGRFVSYQIEGSSEEYICEYDEDGNLLSARTNYGDYRVELGHTFTYDSQGRLKSETQYRRDCTILCEYHYDGDLLSSVDYYQAPTIPDADFEFLYSIEYEYDEDGRLEERSSENFLYSYSYDKNGYLETVEIYSEEQDTLQEWEYTCDEYGNITCVEYSTGERVEWEYEEMTVTPEQAAAYRNQFFARERGSNGYFNYDSCFFYYLIPNPRKEPDILFRFN